MTNHYRAAERALHDAQQGPREPLYPLLTALTHAVLAAVDTLNEKED